MPVELVNQALCESNDVQEFLTGGDYNISSTPEDTINALINLFSLAMEGGAFLDRGLEKKERVEFFDGGCSYVQVACPPFSVSEAGEIENVMVWDGGSTRDFSDGNRLTIYDDFGVSEKTGTVRMLYAVFGVGSRSVKVQYTGGLVETKKPKSAPWDLRQACAMQVANWWQHRSDLALDSVSVPAGGSLQLSDPSKLLPFVRQVIHKNRRFRGPW